MGNSYNNAGQVGPAVTDNSGNNRNRLEITSTAYTPTIWTDGAAPVLGNGTIAGTYARSGTMITVSIELTVGTTTSIGSGELHFSLPYTTFTLGSQLGSGYVYHAGFHTLVAEALGGTAYLRAITPDHGVLNHYSPVWWNGTGWQPGDILRMSITYIL
jgi:hypothetical protein